MWLNFCGGEAGVVPMEMATFPSFVAKLDRWSSPGIYLLYELALSVAEADSPVARVAGNKHHITSHELFLLM